MLICIVYKASTSQMMAYLEKGEYTYQRRNKKLNLKSQEAKELLKKWLHEENRINSLAETIFTGS